MVGVQHAGDSVESETIEVVLLHPEAQVAEQEAQDFVMTVVEQPAVPQLVSSLGTLVEVEMVAAVKHVETVKHVLRCVTVYHVQQDCDAHSMRSINELLQIVWEAITAACSKEAVDLVTKTRVVCMLHDGHELYSVVS